MGLSHDRIPTPAPAPEVCPATPGRDAPNTRAAEFPAAQDESRLAAEAILASSPLAGFFYDALVADPLTATRDALFTAFVLDWSGFNVLLTTVDHAANAERALTSDPGREGLLCGLRAGIASGKRAFQVLPTEWELDVLLGLCDANTAPLTAEFIAAAYDAEREGLARSLRERAGDNPALADGASRLMALLDGPDTCAAGDEGANPTGSWFDRGVDTLVDGHAELVDDLVQPAADVPLLGTWTQFGAASAKTGAQIAGGAAKGLGDLVGGISNMAQHPIETTKGLLNLAEHVPGSPLKLLHKLTDVATGHKTPAESLFTNDLAEDLDFWQQAGASIAQPFVDAIRLGKPAEAAGRAAFDVGSMFVGAGELRAASAGTCVAKQFSKKADDVARSPKPMSGPAADRPRISQVSSGGKRNELPIPQELRTEILAYARSLGIPDEIIRFSEHMNTSYAQLFGEEVLYVGTDVLPAADGATRAASANARVSWKGAIAHEAVGHREAALAGRTQESMLLEEAQASIRAARLGPDLSRVERFTLLRDAIERLHAGGLSIRDVKNLLWTE